MPGWEDRIETIGANLLTLEVNTALKEGMSAEKMPEVPIALHQIIESYGSHLPRVKAGVTGLHFGVTRELLQKAAARLFSKSQAGEQRVKGEALRRELEAWTPSQNQSPAGTLTNGPETFEALQWAANAALVALATGKAAVEGSDRSTDREAALLVRIISNSLQLKEVALLLERVFSSGAGTKGQTNPQTPEQRLQAVVAGAPPDLDDSRLFGGTVDQTVAALFRYPRPSLSIDPDMTVLVRKIWDIGLEEIMFQTTIQIDGDVMLRATGSLKGDDRAFVDSLHRACVDQALAQWRGLFQIVGDLIKGLAGDIFGRARESKSS